MSFSLFVVSLTVLMFFLSNQVEGEHSDYSANIINPQTNHSNNDHSNNDQADLYQAHLGENSGPMVAVGLDGSIDYISEEIMKNYDLTEQEIKENPYFNYIHPDDLPGVIASVGQVFENEAPVSIIGPFRMKVKQPEYSVFIASLYPITSPEKKVINVAILLRDITDEINLPNEQLKGTEAIDTEDDISLEEQIEKQTEFLQLYNNFKQDIIKEIKTEESIVEQLDETLTETQTLPLPTEEIVQPQLEETTEDNKKDKKIRDEKDKDSRLLVQNNFIEYGFFNPFWPFLSR